MGTVIKVLKALVPFLPLLVRSLGVKSGPKLDPIPEPPPPAPPKLKVVKPGDLN